MSATLQAHPKMSIESKVIESLTAENDSLRDKLQAALEDRRSYRTLYRQSLKVLKEIQGLATAQLS
jgi:hypothetical protein